MPIEFRCTTCDRLLRVPEETVGKTAKCPVCGALLKVPAPPVMPVAPPPPPGSTERPWNAAEPQNPFTSPVSAPAFPTGDDSDRTGPPWERDGASLSSCLATIQLAITNPTVAFRTMRRVGGLAQPFYFAMSVGWVANAVAGLEQILLPQLMRRPPGAQMRFVTDHTLTILAMIFAPLIIFIILHIRAGITHLMLTMLSGARFPYETTFRTVSYCTGSTSPIIMIPYFGAFISAIANIVYSIIALAEAQEISGGKATAAVLLPFVIICCCTGPLLGALFFTTLR